MPPKIVTRELAMQIELAIENMPSMDPLRSSELSYRLHQAVQGMAELVQQAKNGQKVSMSAFCRYFRNFNKIYRECFSEEDIRSINSRIDQVRSLITADSSQSKDNRIVTPEIAEEIEEVIRHLPEPLQVLDRRRQVIISRTIKRVRKRLQQALDGSHVPIEEICAMIKNYVDVLPVHYSQEDIKIIRNSIAKVRKAINSSTTVDPVARQEQPTPPSIEDKQVDLCETSSGQFIVASNQMREVMKVVQILANEELSVLIQGETGVGKEFIARALHDLSCRKSEPFITINCSAIPSELLESELFGYKQGAFTGATRDRQGILTTVACGTLFLDEIGDMPLCLQSKMLRILHERRFRPIGSRENGEHSFRGRVITATKRDLPKEVIAGNFRKDLFYRICQFDLQIPPLKERQDDIIPIATSLLGRIDSSLVLSGPAEQKLLDHPYPGNVRELELVLRRALIFKKLHHPEDNIIQPDDIQFTALSI